MLRQLGGPHLKHTRTAAPGRPCRPPFGSARRVDRQIIASACSQRCYGYKMIGDVNSYDCHWPNLPRSATLPWRTVGETIRYICNGVVSPLARRRDRGSLPEPRPSGTVRGCGRLSSGAPRSEVVGDAEVESSTPILFLSRLTGMAMACAKARQRRIGKAGHDDGDRAQVAEVSAIVTFARARLGSVVWRRYQSADHAHHDRKTSAQSPRHDAKRRFQRSCHEDSFLPNSMTGKRRTRLIIDKARTKTIVSSLGRLKPAYRSRRWRNKRGVCLSFRSVGSQNAQTGEDSQGRRKCRGVGSQTRSAPGPHRMDAAIGMMARCQRLSFQNCAIARPE